MNSDPRWGNDRAARHAPPLDEEELETGEPIPGESEPLPVVKKIPALHGRFTEKPSGQTEAYSPPAGQIALSSAKYLKANPDRTDYSKSNKSGSGSESDHSGRSFAGHVMNSGLGGGLLAMGGAVVWFGAGLANGVVFFYPPILFALGLIAFLKGLSGEK